MKTIPESCWMWDCIESLFVRPGRLSFYFLAVVVNSFPKGLLNELNYKVLFRIKSIRLGNLKKD